jgi:hypothetical protein
LHNNKFEKIPFSSNDNIFSLIIIRMKGHNVECAFKKQTLLTYFGWGLQTIYGTILVGTMVMFATGGFNY